MSNPIIAKTGEDRYCLVKPPDDAYNFSLETNRGKLNVSYETKLSVYETIETPFKYASIVGIGKDLTEDQWKGVELEIAVHMEDNEKLVKDGYWNYEGGNPFKTRTESGFSFLRSHGADENYLILKEVK